MLSFHGFAYVVVVVFGEGALSEGVDKEEELYEMVRRGLDGMFLCNALTLADTLAFLSYELLSLLLLLCVVVGFSAFDMKLRFCAFSHYRFLYLCTFAFSVCFGVLLKAFYCCYYC